MTEIYDNYFAFRKFAVTKENNVLIFHSPGQTREFNPFVLYRTFYGAYDETVSIDWTTDSQYVNNLENVIFLWEKFWKYANEIIL